MTLCNYSGVTTYSHARRGNSLWDARRPTRRRVWNEKALTPRRSPASGEGRQFPLPWGEGLGEGPYSHDPLLYWRVNYCLVRRT